jgi:hypothetical protein
MSHQQFQRNQRNEYRNDLLATSKATAGRPLPRPQRPTAVVNQPTARSNTFTLPAPSNEIKVKGPKHRQTHDYAQREAWKEHEKINSSVATVASQKKSIMHQNGPLRPPLKQLTSEIDQRKPVRFASNSNAYYASTANVSPTATMTTAYPIPYSNPTYVVQPSIRTQPMRHRTDPSTYAYTNHHPTVSDISMNNSLPPLVQPTHQTAPTIIIRPKEMPPTDVSSMNTSSYPSIPFMMLPSPSMMLPSTVTSNQPFTSSYFLPTSANPAYFSQPYMYSIPYSTPPSLPSAPVQPSTIVNQSSSSSSSSVTVPPPVKYENVIEEKHPTIIVSPHMTTSDKKNITIHLQMHDEV